MDKQKQGLNVGVKSFLTAIVVILLLMILTYGLTFLIPGGEYARTLDAVGNLIIDTNGVTVENFLSTIDQDKCKHCGVCVEKCPKKTIVKL